MAPAPAGANHAEGESPTELATTVANTPEEVRKQERLATLTSMVSEAISSLSITGFVVSTLGTASWPTGNVARGGGRACVNSMCHPITVIISSFHTQAIAMGVMEGGASAITLGLFLLLPLQPSEVGQPETETNELLLLWFITFVFEVLIPEGLIAYFSQVTSRAQAGRFGDVVAMLKSEKFSKQNQLGEEGS